MPKKRIPVSLVLAIALALMVVGWRVWKRLPPYERGLHMETVEAGGERAEGSGPRIGNCPVFPADNVWNTPVDKLPKDPKADAYVDSIGALHTMHPDFGSNLNSGFPYTEVPAGTRGTHITFDYQDESDLGNYPMPADPPIEGGKTAKGDRHVILIDPRRCLLYELFAVEGSAETGWKAGSGIKMDLTSNALRGDTKTSADAAGLAILPGLVRYEEVQAGEITHAIRFTLPKTQAAYIWPARHMSSRDKDPSNPPMGARFRLRADFDISKYSRTNQILLKAMQRYGLILADNGSPLFISGVSDKRWDDSDLHKLNGVKAEDLEAVDESSLQMLPDSARVDPTVKH